MNPEGFALLSYILSDYFEPKLGESHDLFRGGEKGGKVLVLPFASSEGSTITLLGSYAPT